MHPNERQGKRRAELFAKIRDQERQEREEKEAALQNRTGKATSAKGAPTKTGTKKRQAKRTLGRSKG